jgi:hypothetical protein
MEEINLEFLYDKPFLESELKKKMKMILKIY